VSRIVGKECVTQDFLGCVCVHAAGLSCVRKGLGGSFYKIFVWVLLSLNTRCGRGRACFVVVGKIGAFISDRFRWILSDISSLPRRNATGVVCIFLIWGIDDVYCFIFCEAADSGVRWAIVVAGLDSCVFSCA
jgi:hypothetical protein